MTIQIVTSFMHTVSIAEAKAHLSELIERVEKGEEILITKRGKPVVRLVPDLPPPPATARPRRIAGRIAAAGRTRG